MGMKSDEALDLGYEELADYLGAKHSAYMEYADTLYYLTDVNEHYWRAQSTAEFNEKGHYTDVSELVNTVEEFLHLPFLDGKSIADVYQNATFYASVKPGE